MSKSQLPPCPPCPVCETNKHVNAMVEQFYCSKCQGTFHDADEGGDYSDHNPAARLEREEREQQRRKDRFNRKFRGGK